MAGSTTKTGAAATKAVASNDNELKELKEMMAQKDKENEELKEMIKQLGELVKLSAQNASANNVVSAPAEDEDLVYINNNSIGRQLIVLDKLGSTSLIIQPSERNRPIEKSYIKQAMQLVNMRKMFELGVLEFEDERFYKIYGIERKFDMSEDNVLKMFSIENINSTVSQLNTMFRREENDTLKHELCYKALDLVQRGKLPMEETNTINASLNKIFCVGTNVTFNALMSNLAFKRGDA